MPDTPTQADVPENPRSIKHTHTLIKKRKEKTDSGYSTVWTCKSTDCDYAVAMFTDGDGRLQLTD